MINTTKAEKVKAVLGKHGLFITNFQPGTPTRRQVAVDGKLHVQEEGGQWSKYNCRI